MRDTSLFQIVLIIPPSTGLYKISSITQGP